MDRLPDEAEEGPSTWRTYATWGSFGLGAAALGLGIISHLQHASDLSEFNEEDGGCFKERGNVIGGTRCERLDSAIASDMTRLTIGYVGAAVFASVGTVLWLTKPRADSSSVACGIGPGHTLASSFKSWSSFQCSGTF